MQPPRTPSQIITDLKTYYGINTTELILLPISAEINTLAYKAKTLNQAYFVKFNYDHKQDSRLEILELLQQAKVPLIIPPMPTINGQLLQCIDDVSLIVQPFIDGQNCFSHRLTDVQWIALGKSLRFIHDLSIPTSIQAKLRKENLSPKWRAQVKSLYHLFEDNSNIKNRDEISQNLLNFLKIHNNAIHKLVNRAEELTEECQIDSSSFVLCHADLHAGNILVDNNNELYIVDWDNPILAQKERDLMFIGGGVGNVWNNQNEVELFYTGYGEAKINRNLLAYYRHERIIEDIAIYIQHILFTHDQNRLEMYQHFVELFDDRGVVEMAFETNEKNWG